MEWISVKDRLPEHGQHVLVSEDRFNVYAFPIGNKGDDGKGRIRMGDAVYWCGETMWREENERYGSQWKSREEYKKGHYWDRWRGHGSCEFGDVTHWMSLPDMPTGRTI